MTHGHLGHVLDADRHALIGFDDDVLDLLDVDRAADAVHQQHIAGAIEVASAHVEIVVRYGRHDLHFHGLLRAGKPPMQVGG